MLSALLLFAASAFGFGVAGKPHSSSMAAETSDDRLAEAATKIGWTLQRVKEVALRDKDLRVSSDNRLFYACKFSNPAASTFVGGSSQVQSGPDTSTYTGVPPTVNATSAFQLHSRPGAAKTLYLDFTGHTTPAGYWATGAVTIPAFKLAGTATPTDQANLNAIRDIWLHVAEDFAAWDIDVTTDATGISTKAGLRCVIGGRQNAVPGLGFGTMGVAYIGSFGNPLFLNDRLNGQDCNNFVFVDCTGTGAGETNPALNPTTSNYEVTILCVAHEVGHTVGLNHWGETPPTPAPGGTGLAYTRGHAVSGHTGVASVSPIMGNSSFPGWPSVCNLNQWSKGDYPFSLVYTNSGTQPAQDDIAIISTFANKLVGSRDDHGDTLLAATVVSGTSITAGGVIADSTDVDLMKITPGVGMLTLTATPHLKYRNYNGNLKIGLSLLNASGNAVAGSYSLSGMGATLTYNVPTAGTYYIKVNGLGYDPTRGVNQVPTNTGVTGTVVGTSAGFTNYGSIGRYGLTGNWQPLIIAPVAVIGSDRTAGVAPVTVAFNGTGSSDADGLIAGYTWSFGDPASGSVANTSTLASPSHTYAAPGTYKATLVVRDNQGNASAQAERFITVSGSPIANSVRVGSMVGSWAPVSNVEVSGSATIQVLNQYGQPLRGVAVYVRVTGSATGTASAKSDANGFVTIQMPKKRASIAATYTFTVTSLVLASYPYNSLANTPSTASVTISR